MFRKLGIFYTLCRKLGIFYTLCRKLGIFYTLRLTPEAKTRTLIGFIAKKHCEEKNLSSEKIRHTSMVNTWKIKKIDCFYVLEIILFLFLRAADDIRSWRFWELWMEVNCTTIAMNRIQSKQEKFKKHFGLMTPKPPWMNPCCTTSGSINCHLTFSYINQLFSKHGP